MKQLSRKCFLSALLIFSSAPLLASPYNIEVHATFTGGFAPWHANPPAVNSLSDLIGTAFNGIYQSDSDPDAVPGRVKAVDGNNIGWYLPGYRLSVASGLSGQLPILYGDGSSPATTNDRLFSASETYGLAPEGVYDQFGIWGGNITGNNGCTPLDDPSCGGGSGIGFSLGLFGSATMLADPNRPGPDTIDINAVQLVILDASEWLNGTQIGSAYIIGRLAPGSTLNNLTITAVPLPAAFWLFGSAAMGLLACRRKKS